MIERRSTRRSGSSASRGRPSGCLVRARRSRKRQTRWGPASRPITAGVTSNGGMKADDAKRLKELKRENRQLKAIVADHALEEPGITRCRTPTVAQAPRQIQAETAPGLAARAMCNNQRSYCHRFHDDPAASLDPTPPTDASVSARGPSALSSTLPRRPHCLRERQPGQRWTRRSTWTSSGSARARGDEATASRRRSGSR